MNNKGRFLFALLGIVFFISCEKEQDSKNTIDGLWLVKKVKMGDQEMTPIARWMRFNKDSSQVSGNGWLQHSMGSWSYNLKSNTLSITNTNGIADEFEPFQVNLQDQIMKWNRTEDGRPIEVTLERIHKLPTSEANKLYGLWRFDSIFEDDKEISKTLNPSKKGMLFLRWDGTYELRNYPEGEQYGIFKTHAHRPQLDMVSYSKEPEYQFYEFRVNNNTLTLTATNKEKQLKLTRIHQFLE